MSIVYENIKKQGGIFVFLYLFMSLYPQNKNEISRFMIHKTV